MSDFKNKKTKKTKSKILEFKTKSLREQKIETNQDIWNKMDSYAKELVEAFDEKSNRENIDRDHCLYLFHYRLMQKMMITGVITLKLVPTCKTVSTIFK